MKPLNLDKSGCSNISSNCVVWQGPDIECIALCKGDSVTEVVYKLALELCVIMDTFDLNQYDLSCFAGGACKPENFKAFIQLLIKKVCYIQECSGCLNSCDPCNTTVTPNVPLVPSPSGGDPVVPIAPAFRYVNAFGDTVTTMLTSEYTVTIGNTVSGIITSISTINATLSNHSTRITTLENAPAPVYTVPDMTPVCVLPANPTDSFTVLRALEQQFCALRVATGEPNVIFTNIGKQPANLDSENSLANPLTTLGALPGFTDVVQNEAQSVGNMWVVISDMRLALKNIINNYLPSDCAGIGLTMYASYTPTTLTIFIDGTIPGNFSNTFQAGTVFTIADNFGASITTNINIISILNNILGFAINLTGSPLNLSSNLTITANPSFNSIAPVAQCQSFLSYVLVNQANCVPVVYTPFATKIGFAYTTGPITATYKMEIRNALTNVVINTASVPNTIVQNVTGEFLGLVTLTQYKLRLIITINGVDTNCDFTLVTTL